MTTNTRTRTVAGAAFALTVLLASAWSEDLPLKIKVLSAESRQFQVPVLVPPNCNFQDISAYCHGSSPRTYVESTMVVEEPDGRSLTIACTADARWSHCSGLPVNQSFEARMGKHGLEIRYPDQHGKMRERVYEILKQNGES